MEFTLTENLLDKAIKLRGNADENYSVCENCPIALAIKDKVKDKRVQTSYGDSYIGESLYENNIFVKKIISLFDSRKFEQIRLLLPFTFHLNLPQ